MGEHLLLIGMMGSGKSTVAAILAGRLGADLLDTDAEVVAVTGRSVPEVFVEGGEGEFRSLESAVVRRLASLERRTIVSVAGGAVLDPCNREVLRGAGSVVFLRARPDTLAARLGGTGDRPLLAGAPEGRLARLAAIDAARRPLYEDLADVVVDVDNLAPPEVADRVMAAVAER